MALRLRTRAAFRRFALRQSQMQERYEDELLRLRSSQEAAIEASRVPPQPMPTPSLPSSEAAGTSDSASKPDDVSGSEPNDGDSPSDAPPGTAVVKYLYSLLCSLYASSTEPIRANLERESSSKQAWSDRVSAAKHEEV